MQSMQGTDRALTVDAHFHLWSVARGDYGWLTPDQETLYRDFSAADARARMDPAQIDKGVLVQAAPTVAETDDLLKIADRHDWVAAVVGWIDFEAGDVLDTLDRLAAHPKLRSIRPMIQDISDPDWMLTPEFARVWQAIADRGLAFDALVLPRHLPNLLTLLGRHPDLPCVIDHCAKPRIAKPRIAKPRIADGAFAPWARTMSMLAAETNALVKLSGLATEAGAGWTAETLRPYVDHVLGAFGPSRVMWGSDWPVLRLNGSYASWREASAALLSGLPAEERAAIYGGTATRFYRLQET